MRVVLCVTPEHESALLAEIERDGNEVLARVSDAQELALISATVRPDIVIVAADAQRLDQRVLTACDDVGARLVVLVADDAGRRRAAGLGIMATVSSVASWREMQAASTGAMLPAVTPPRSGTVIAVWGPVGAPGRTTVAITLAAELAARGHSVALADVDTHGASIAPALGLLDEAPGFAAACRLAGSGSLTSAELERVSSRYESVTGAFWVLTGIGRPSRWPELSADRVTQTIASCRAWVEYTVLDTSSSLENDEEIVSDLFAPRRNAATLTALRDADHVVAVGAADPVGLARFLRAHVDLMEAASSARVTVVVNKVRSSAVGLDPFGQVRHTLSRFGGVDDPVLVPQDVTAVDGAVLSGRTLTDSAPRAAVRAALRDLVSARILPPETEPRTRRERRVLGARSTPTRVRLLGRR